MKASSSVATPRALTRFGRRVGREHAARIHERDAIAALGLIHEMGRDKNGHALIAREIDQQFPETVPCQRIDTRGRLVEDEDLGLVDDGDGEREPLANPQRQIRGALIEIISRPNRPTTRQYAPSPFAPAGGKGAREDRGSAGRSARHKRERLRHVTDSVSRAHVSVHRGVVRTRAPRLRSAAAGR